MQPQVILITGASSGFGKITAQMLSERGHIVYGTSRKPSGNMNNVKMLVADVTNILSIHEAVGQIISEQGRIDVLINNAGMGIGGALELATEDEISGQMNTNFFGVVNMCKGAALYAQGTSGKDYQYQLYWWSDGHPLSGILFCIQVCSRGI